jgi:hypothetical protein
LLNSGNNQAARRRVCELIAEGDLATDPAAHYRFGQLHRRFSHRRSRRRLTRWSERG